MLLNENITEKRTIFLFLVKSQFIEEKITMKKEKEKTFYCCQKEKRKKLNKKKISIGKTFKMFF